MNEIDIEITTYDRLLRAWENSIELVRDYEMYSKRVTDEEVKNLFKKLAEDEGAHAAALREMLLKRKRERGEKEGYMTPMRDDFF